MVESSANKLQKAVEMHKYFWMVTQDIYDNLRQIDGCENLKDLNATKTDGGYIQEMARKIGVPKENTFIDIRPSQKDLKKSYSKIMMASRTHTVDKEPHLIFVYVGGHGCTDNEKQIYLLNESESSKAMFHIEFKLRYLINDPMSTARIFAVYDCCRVKLSSMPGLVAGRGAGCGDFNEEESEDETPCKYFHLQACGPGGIADADGGFAERVLEQCKKFAAREPNKGFMEWPRDMMRVKWSPGQIANTGGDDYMVPFSDTPGYTPPPKRAGR